MTEELFRREAVRHNTPGLFGEVRLSAPPASWVVTAISVAALALIAALLFGLDVGEQSLLAWILSR